MGAFAINGRQVWTLLLHSPTVGSGYLEKIYGLHFDPAQVNMVYLKQNFGAAAALATEGGGVGDLLQGYLRTTVVNLDDLYSTRLTALIGHLAMIFFAFGIMHLYRTGRRFEVVLILAFIACGLVAPLLHNVVIRHIVVVAPIMLLVAGIGVVSVAEMLAGSQSKESHTAPTIVAMALTFLVVAAWALPIRAALTPPDRNREYSYAELKEPARIIKDSAGAFAHRKPRVMARRAYIAYLANAEFIIMPYADYAGLLRYSALNEVDFVFLNPEAEQFPFFEKFASDSVNTHFKLVYRGEDADGAPVTLYRFHSGED
jgi:hypothetical protein